MTMLLHLKKVNPHFTFNVLDSIAGLIAAGESNKARRFIGKFGKLFRQVLIDDGKLTWTLEEELEFVKDYLELEGLRFNDNFEYSIKVSDAVKLTSYVPKLIIQSFVNNAIKYAVEPKKNDDGRILIFVDQKNNILTLKIEDNGSGIYSSELKKDNNGIKKGIVMAKDTISLLNARYSKPASLSITEIKDSKGATVGTRIEILLFSQYDNI